ncbi:MAG: cytochrome d ubiquinol oxidase subunit II [Bacteroidales bacterium]|nr:cytochrome d ubiquinol oxidase subunit II [Bacteroidales bacterium]
MELHDLQTYWWILISIIGALLVFLLFVQGGQTLLYRANGVTMRQMMINSLGRKWEITFTTLVLFGGAFFAAFPLFYSTTFGGAYWLWSLILLSFVVQAFSYEFRRKPGNLFGRRFYDILLFINGCAGCILLGVAVGTMFFGAEFTIAKGNIANAESPMISTWSNTHGIEAIYSLKNLLVGFTVLYLARTQAAFYFMNNLDGDQVIMSRSRRSMMINGGIFVVLFLIMMSFIFAATGYEEQPDGSIIAVKYKYFYNMIDMWWIGLIFLAGVTTVVFSIIYTILTPEHNRRGIWYCGIGTVLTIFALFCILGLNNTAYYPSLLDVNSSLTITNSSSSQYTLTVMSYASLFVPVVLAYIGYVWYKFDSEHITPEEMDKEDHLY